MIHELKTYNLNRETHNDIELARFVLDKFCYTSKEASCYLYGSYPVLGHQNARDIDILVVDNTDHDISHIHANHVFSTSRRLPINIYVINPSLFLADALQFQFGGKWVLTLALGATIIKAPEFAHNYIGLAISSAIRLFGIQPSQHTRDTLIQLLLNLSKYFPFFIKTAIQLFLHPEWLAYVIRMIEDHYLNHTVSNYSTSIQQPLLHEIATTHWQWNIATKCNKTGNTEIRTKLNSIELYLVKNKDIVVSVFGRRAYEAMEHSIRIGHANIDCAIPNFPITHVLL